MTDVPDHWPVDEVPRVVAPLFPLPNVWLFPGAILPLNVFEPRYRKMVEDCLDGPGRIVLASVAPEHAGELAGSPPVHPIAGIGEIGRHDRLPDGRFVIVLVGLARVRIQEVASEEPYRIVEAERLDEVDVPRQDEAALRSELAEAIKDRTGTDLSKITGREMAGELGRKLPEGLADGPLLDQMPLGRLADLLILRMSLSHEAMTELYGELDPRARARAALRAHGGERDDG